LLLDRVGISKEERRAIERDRRSRAIPLTVNGFTIEIRDQKPLSLSRLKSALKDATVPEWLLMLNERVFFWPSEDRLKHFLQAASYAKSVHLVIEVDTKALLDHCDERVFISSMNTGTTSPYAASRGRSTFQLVTEYPRRRRSTVAEVSVVGGVPDVRAVAKRVYRFFDGAEIERVHEEPSPSCRMPIAGVPVHLHRARILREIRAAPGPLLVASGRDPAPISAERRISGLRPSRVTSKTLPLAGNPGRN
jgi:hypothetical protein